MIRSAPVVVLFVVLPGCGGHDGSVSSESVASTAMCADVVNVEVVPESGGTYRFDVTVRSSETGWDKYADAWEVRAPDGSVLGTRILAHPHVDEQPFTRSLNGVAIPADITEVEVAARDLVDGFCGLTVQAPIPSS